MFLEAEEVEPIGFGEDAERFPLLLKFFGEGEFDGGVSIGFEGPTFFTDDEDGGLSADVAHRSSAVAFDELETLAMGHGGESPREGDAFPGEGEWGIPGSGEIGIGVAVFGVCHGTGLLGERTW